MEKTLFIDNQIVKFWSEHHTSFFDTFFKVITFLGNAEFVIPMFFVVSMIIFYKKRDFLFSFFVSFFSSIIITFILKYSLQRERPIYATFLENGFSFPSGHATFAIGFYGFLAYITYKYFKQKNNYLYSKIILIETIIFILLLGFSRIYFGVHYPTDVLAGFAVGMIGFCFGIIFYNKRKILLKQ